MFKRQILLAVELILCSCVFAFGQERPATPTVGSRIPRNSKIYMNPMEGGFEIHVTAAIQKKRIPVLIVADREQADFEIKGAVEKQKAGWAKTIFFSPLPSIDSTMQIVDVKSGVVV